MKIEVISTLAQLGALQQRWNALLEASDCNVIHLSYEWFLSSWECFHANDRMHVVHICDHHDQSVLIAPMVICQSRYRGIALRKVCFPLNEQTPYNGLITKRKHAAQGVAVLWSHLNSFASWDLVDLQKLHEIDEMTHAVKALISQDTSFWGVRENIDSPYIPVVGSWEDFFSQRSSRFRKSLRNKINRVKREKNIEVVRVEIKNGQAPQLEEIVRISKKSWKKEIGTDLVSREENRKFYHEICERFGPKGFVSIWFLQNQTEPIAFEFHLTYNKVVYPIRADYDASFKKISPGSVLEFNILQTLFTEKQVDEYNSCGHTYQYLLNWTDKKRHCEDIEVFKKTPFFILLYILEYSIIPKLRYFGVNKIYKIIKGMNRQ